MRTSVVGDPFPQTITLIAGARECAGIQVDVASYQFRRCVENRAFVRYVNIGTQAATDAILTVAVDPFLIDFTASEEFTRRAITWCSTWVTSPPAQVGVSS